MIFGAIVFLLISAAVYGFLIAPNIIKRKIDLRSFTQWAYAHRGLHSEASGYPENTLPAFRAAVQKGYGIELDVRLTMDNELVVHHDRTLSLSCGDERPVSRITLAELSKLRVFGSSEGIPTLKTVLNEISGKVPLIIELKTDRLNQVLPRLTYECLSAYKGLWCIASFNPAVLLWFRRNAPDTVRGQLIHYTSNATGTAVKERIRDFISENMLTNFLSRPDFIAYHWKADREWSIRIVSHVFRPLLVAWSISSPNDYKRIRAACDICIFEKFEPKLLRKNKEITNKEILS